MGPTALLPFRRKACSGFFFSPWKILTASAGFEPANLGCWCVTWPSLSGCDDCIPARHEKVTGWFHTSFHQGASVSRLISLRLCENAPDLGKMQVFFLVVRQNLMWRWTRLSWGIAFCSSDRRCGSKLDTWSELRGLATLSCRQSNSVCMQEALSHCIC